MMSSDEADSHGHGDDDGGHSHNKEGIWRGLVALGGVYFFFLTERIMGIVTDWRRKVNEKQVNILQNDGWCSCVR